LVSLAHFRREFGFRKSDRVLDLLHRLFHLRVLEAEGLDKG
jgi:hypothetical protein